MMIYIRKFKSLAELLSSIDEDLTLIRRHLGELLRMIEELRIKAENEKTLSELFMKLGIEPPKKPANVINLKNLKIVANPSAADELSSLEFLAEYLSRKIITLESIKKELEFLSKVNIEANIEVIYVEGVPKEIYIKY